MRGGSTGAGACVRRERGAHKMMCRLEIGRMMVVKNRLFLGETERTIPRSRPAFRIAGSAGRVKGAKRDRSHAQRSEHREDPPFDAPEHPATIASGWAGDPASASSGIYSVREAEARTEAIKKPAHVHWNSRMMFGWQLQRSESGGCGTRTRSAISGRNRRCGASSATRRPVSLASPGAQKNTVRRLRARTYGMRDEEYLRTQGPDLHAP